MTARFRIRRATPRDAEVISDQRARMFQEMGDVLGDAVEVLRSNAEARLTEWLKSGIYVGWLAFSTGQPNRIVGGAGVQLQAILPRPLTPTTIGEGRQGTVVNVFTEPKWRRCGVATVLMKEIIAWSEKERIERLVLHASDDGRSLYEALGFVSGNEMRFPGED